jgi:hypothetical protein
MLDGISRIDGTLASLAPIDLRRCIRAREKLINTQFQPGYTFGWLQHRSWGHDEDCTGAPGKCDSVRAAGLCKYLRRFQLKALSTLTPGDPRGLCAECKPHGIRLFDAGRKKIWDELPGFFDLPPWSELTNDL